MSVLSSYDSINRYDNNISNIKICSIYDSISRIDSTITLCLTSQHSVQFIAQSYPTLCDPMDCSMPGFPVHHQLLELAQTHVHRVGDAIQPFHSLLFPSPLAFNLSWHQSFPMSPFFCIRWPKYWSFSFSISPFNKYSGLISFRIDGLISLQSKGLSRIFSNTTV